MNALAMQVAFILPLMIALGAHYLPFIFLCDMWQFGALAAV